MVLNIVTQMKHNFKIILRFFAVLAFMASLASSAYADSRSVAVRVSCTIMPLLEIALPVAQMPVSTEPRPRIELRSEESSLVSVNTNLGKDFQLAESVTKIDNALIRLYSVTAL